MSDQSSITSPLAFITSWLTLTPTTLFLLLNLVIGTIALTSRFTSNKHSHHQQRQLGSHDSPGQHHQLARASSLLDRVKSINFSLYNFPSSSHEHDDVSFNPVEPEQPPQLARAPSLLDRVKSINFLPYKFPNPTDEYDTNPGEPGLVGAPSLLERVKSIRLPSVYRSEVMDNEETETETKTVHKPKRSKSETKKSKVKAGENMKKSVSEKSMTVDNDKEVTEMVERRRPETARLERTATIGDGDLSVDAKADDFINKFKSQLRLQRLDSLLRYKELLQRK